MYLPYHTYANLGYQLWMDSMYIRVAHSKANKISLFTIRNRLMAPEGMRYECLRVAIVIPFYTHQVVYLYYFHVYSYILLFSLVCLEG